MQNGMIIGAVCSSLVPALAQAMPECVLVRGRDPIPLDAYDGKSPRLTRVAGDGRYVIYSMPLDWHNNNGRVYWYDSHGDRTIRMLESPSGASIGFGSALAVVDGIAYVGAPDETILAQPAVGSVYVFDLRTGQEIGHLAPPAFTRWGFFGSNIYIHGDRLFVRSSSVWTTEQVTGMVYMYDRHTYDFIREVAPDYLYDMGRYGARSSSTDDTILFSEPGRKDELDFARGSCFLFDPYTGDLIREIQAVGRPDRAGFGYEIALSDNYLAASGKMWSGQSPSGPGFVQVFDPATGEFLHELNHPVNTRYSYGDALAIFDDKLMVGSRGWHAPGGSGGAIFIYDLASGELLQTIERDLYTPYSGPGFGDEFIEADGQFFVRLEDETVNGTRGYYETWVPRSRLLDFAPPRGVDSADFAAFLDAFLLGDLAADIAPPYDRVDYFDLVRYATLYHGGCE